MVGSSEHRDRILLRRVRMHGARDALRARQQLDRALGGVDRTSIGLPPGAMLFVRRLSAPRPTLGATASFGDRVSLDLQRQAQLARRPWLHADARTAEAVLFADEAELVACLIRDWLRGVVGERWWWPTVLGSDDVQQWLRRHALPRGEVLVPATALLEPRAEVAAWVARLQEDETAVAVEAVIRAYAVPITVRGQSVVSRGAADEAEVDVPTSTDPEMAEPRTTAAFSRLDTTVPEWRSSGLRRDQVRLLVLTLAARRSPTWARSPQFVADVSALERIPAQPIAASRIVPASPVHSQPPEVVSSGVQLDSVPEPFERRLRRESPADEAAGIVAPPPERRAATSIREPAHTAASGAHPGEPNSAPTEARVPEAVLDASPPVGEPVFDPSTEAVAEAPVALAESQEPLSDIEAATSSYMAPASRVETQFGGIFYLLNAALAMGLYGDFTTPRAQNLALSPWDWLALVGREWFGDEFVSDPVWKTLADLAVRAPDEDPARDFEMAEGWLEQHLDQLRSRLALALGSDDVNDVTATVCRYLARIEITASCVHVHLALCDLPLDLRIAGLDRDPGWIPAAGRSVAFHFV